MLGLVIRSVQFISFNKDSNSYPRAYEVDGVWISPENTRERTVPCI